MPEIFNPATLRHIAQGNEAFVHTLPEGVSELFEIIRSSNEQGIECGNGLKALGVVATDFLYAGPKAIENAIAFDWSSANGLQVPLQPGELSLTGKDTRPKKVAEYTDEESEAWARFMDGLDPSDSPITRRTAVMGLAGARVAMNTSIGGVSKYSLSPGENHLIFDRTRNILTGTPFILATSVLPDMTADEASRIFSIGPDQYPQTVDTFVENARGPIFETPGL